VHSEQTQSLPGLQDDARGQLHRLLGRLQWQLGLERLALFAVRGTIANGLALIALSTIVWLTSSDVRLVWLSGAPLVASLALALVRWPSRQHTALMADRRLRLEERLATAFELVDTGYAGRFGRLQVRDAVARAQAAPSAWLAFEPRSRNEALLALTMLGAGVAALLLIPSLPRPVAPPPTEEAAGQLDRGVVDELTQGAPPGELPVLAAPSTDESPVTPAVADLASRVQQEQAERSALDKLAQALSSVSAGQSAAEAIQRGEFGAARDELQKLGEEADQLSQAAKQQLAQALEDASAATAQSDRALSDKERQASQALNRSTYTDQRQALRGLAEQVERSGARSVPRDELQRDLGQLQQQSGGAQSAAARRGQTSSGEQSDAASVGTGASDRPQASTAADAGGGDTGQQGGAGSGTGTSPDPGSAQPSRLDTAGQRVEVPQKLSAGPGVRPPDGTEDQLSASPSVGGRSVSELAQAQQTGQVAPEQNLVPGEQRPVVRGYFR
jgi:hypothetical protein